MPFLGSLRLCYFLGVHFIALIAKTPCSGSMWRYIAFSASWLVSLCSVKLCFRSQWLANCRVLSAAPASDILVKARKWFVFASRKKNASAFFLFLSFINNNNNIYIDIDIDIGYLCLSLGYLLPRFRLSVGYLGLCLGYLLALLGYPLLCFYSKGSSYL